MTEYRFETPIRSPEGLRLFLLHAFGVVIPSRSVCPGHCSPWEALVDAYFATHRVSLWTASRAFGGKSYTLALLSLAEACGLKADVSLLGGSGEQSRRVHNYLADAWNHAGSPRRLIVGEPRKMETTLRWGNHIRALLASQSSVRGPHPQRLRLDEVDEMDRAILDAALGQPISRGGIAAQVVLASTYHHPSGSMAYATQLADERGWGRYSWCWRETVRTEENPSGWLEPDEIEAKRGEIPGGMWSIEFDLQIPSNENLAIMPEAVSAMFRVELGSYEGANGELIEIEPPAPGGAYRHGADWARSRDWTVIVTLRVDCVPARVVSFLRLGRRPWPQMVQAFEERIQRYGGKARHDATGIGDVVDGYLTKPAEGVILSGRTRSDLFSNYINAIEKGALVAPDVRYMRHEHSYCTITDLYGSGHPPDSFVACALAAESLVTPQRKAVWLDDDAAMEAEARRYEQAEGLVTAGYRSLLDPRRHF